MVFLTIIYFIRLWTYPFFAHQGYEIPQEATSCIACTNCHLAKKLVDIKVPQFVFSNIVFEVVVKIPYETKIKQVIANGKKKP
ncbi:unnamed protein product [Sphagnum jensenii]|uniref:Cytochrome f large domain-containing protein n=1 Tax=Sphagnum jensenii TaxID=128206 RepID=A0ABP1AH38_9BRYO